MPNVTIFLPNENDGNGYFSAILDKEVGLRSGKKRDKLLLFNFGKLKYF